MARSRRGSTRGFGGPEIRGTLGTLIRSTLAQAGAVREVLERGAREGRARLDDARLERARTDALADLGEVVLELIRDGELADLEELPAIADAVAAIEDVEGRLHGDGRRGGPRAGRDWVVPGASSRFDHSEDREPIGRGRDAWSRGRTKDDESLRRGRDDGTVSSADWRPPKAAAPARVWRPPVDDAPAEDAVPPREAPEPRAKVKRAKPERAASPSGRRDPSREPGAAMLESSRSKPGRGGGIAFSDEDEDLDADLAEYMNPEDVPPKK
jgi:hypothetical protein